MSEQLNPSSASEHAMSNDLLSRNLEAVSNLTGILTEQKRAKKRSLFIKGGIAAAALLSIALTVGKFAPAPAPMTSPEKTAAVVRISGAIMPDGGTSAGNVNPLLERAFSSASSQSVIIVVNSPGGTPVQANLIRDKISKLQAQHKKRVVVVGEDLLTSGAYLIAVAADKIFVDPSSVVGSIGVISKGFGFTGLMDKLGVERRVQTAGTSKNIGDPFSVTSVQEREVQQHMLDSIHKVFIDSVKNGRKDALKLDTPGIFSGTIFVGQEALEAGLVDQLGGIDEAMDYLQVTELERYQQGPRGLLSLLGAVGITAKDTVKELVSTEAASSALPLATYSGQ